MTERAADEGGGPPGRLFHQQAHLVSHTHWDREWYEPAGRFRQRLVALIDELLDAPPPAGAFLLDGQMVVVEDYLAVRPERVAELSALLRDGRLEAGPWYVLADELIPSGEALVRNLLAGRRDLRALRAEAPPVLYCPDSFGHPASLPMIAQGFGYELIVLWRGYGSSRWPVSDVVRWHAPDGSLAVIYHLPRSGYEVGSNLPSELGKAAERWTQLLTALSDRSETGVILILNGADHHARQADLEESVSALQDAASPHLVLRSSLRDFAKGVLEANRSRELRGVRGELRDSYGFTWTLQGTLASRAAQKRRNAQAERMLIRECEPFVALAARTGHRDQRTLLHAAWRTLLKCHPHDTLCGCSIDEVARAMEVRLDDARTQAVGMRADAVAALVGHDAAVTPMRREEWKPACVIWNATPRPRGGVAEVQIDTALYRVPVGPGSGAAAAPTRVKRAPVAIDGTQAMQTLSREVLVTRTESPRHYPIAERTERTSALVWVEPISGYSAAPFALRGARTSRKLPPRPVVATGLSIENGYLRVSVTALGTIRVDDLSTGRSIDSLVTFEDVGDRGDLYTHSSAGDVVTETQFLGARPIHTGPLRGEIALRMRLTLPASRLSSRARPRSTMRRSSVRLPLQISVSLDAGDQHVRIRVQGTNPARDHRLRIVFHTGVANAEVYADAAFGPVQRKPIVIAPEEAAIEQAPPTAPLHRYVSLFDPESGVTVFSDGLAEYEATPAGDVAVTLVRAVGHLSRNDLPERPGHAGWPVDTPEAQCPGAFEAAFAVMLHGARTNSVIHRIERIADDVLLPLRGSTIRSAIGLSHSTGSIELIGEGLAFSAAKPSEDGRWLVLRCVNLLDDAVAGQWRLEPAPAEAHLAQLDETVLSAAKIRDNRVTFVAGPRAAVTVLIK